MSYSGREADQSEEECSRLLHFGCGKCITCAEYRIKKAVKMMRVISNFDFDAKKFRPHVKDVKSCEPILVGENEDEMRKNSFVQQNLRREWNSRASSIAHYKKSFRCATRADILKPSWIILF